MQVLLVEMRIIEERVWQGVFEPTWTPYGNCHYLLRMKNGKYHFNISAENEKWHLMEDTGIPPIVKECSEVFPGLQIILLIDLHSGYDTIVLCEDGWYYVAFQTADGRYKVTAQIQGACNSLLAFLQVSQKVYNIHLMSIVDMMFDNVGVKGLKCRYREQVGKGSPRIERLVTEHLQNLPNVLAIVERAQLTIS